jgi:hypothetical protein
MTSKSDAPFPDAQVVGIAVVLKDDVCSGTNAMEECSLFGALLGVDTRHDEENER